jgi:hypothetical protein
MQPFHPEVNNGHFLHIGTPRDFREAFNLCAQSLGQQAWSFGELEELKKRPDLLCSPKVVAAIVGERVNLGNGPQGREIARHIRRLNPQLPIIAVAQEGTCTWADDTFTQLENFELLLDALLGYGYPVFSEEVLQYLMNIR